VIPINPTDEADIARLTARITALHKTKKSHSLKKLPKDQQTSSKKRKASDQDSPTDAKTDETAAAKKQKSAPKINNPTTANMAAAVLKEEKERDKLRNEMSDNLKSLYSKKKEAGIGGGDFLAAAQTKVKR